MKNSLFVMGLAALSAGVVGQAPSRGPEFEKAKQAFEKAVRAEQELERLGRESEASGRFDQAESFYFQAHQTRPDMLSPHLLPARLYDRQGLDDKARRAYKEYLRHRKNVVSTSQHDPRILARFGDLSLKLGFTEDATQAFEDAAKAGPDGQFEPQTVPVRKTITMLKSAAHAASAWEHGTHSSTELEIAEAKLAVETAPNWWIPHYFLGRAYITHNMRTEGLKELDIAAKGAPKSGLAQIEFVRSFR